MNWKMANEAAAATPKGITTRRNSVHSPAPSIRPASIRAVGRSREEVAHQEHAEGQPESDVEDDHAGDGPERVPAESRAHVLVQSGNGYERHLQRHHHQADDRQKDGIAASPPAKNDGVGSKARD